MLQLNLYIQRENRAVLMRDYMYKLKRQHVQTQACKHMYQKHIKSKACVVYLVDFPA